MLFDTSMSHMLMLFYVLCWTDYNQVQRVTRKLKAGTTWVNQYVILHAQVPFGGMKSSGYGRELGMQGIDEYLTTKSVHHYYGEPLEWPIKL